MNRNVPVPFLGEEQRQRWLLTRLRALVPKGVHVGRVLVRATGSFDIKTKHERLGGISAKYCRAVHHNDGYSYAEGGGNSSLA